ncbi:MAG: hypothetical protein BJ554DRAFT_1446, partial [Olpidium bornovanus]
MLARIRHYTLDEIRTAILQVDESVLTEQTIKQFLAFVPTAEEKGKLTAYTDNPEALAKGDRFFLEMMKIDRYEPRLKAWYFKMTFGERFRELEEQEFWQLPFFNTANCASLVQDVNAIFAASQALKESKTFLKILEVILTIGNFMNGTGYRGGAFGFRINSINKLVDTKSTDNKTTLLHFLASTVESKFPELLQIQTELNDVGPACRVSFAALRAEYAEIKSKLRMIRQELESHHADSENRQPDDKFVDMMTEFMSTAGEQFDNLDIRFTSMNIAYQDVVRMYGEDSSTMPPEEFFGIFRTFLSSFE